MSQKRSRVLGLGSRSLLALVIVALLLWPIGALLERGAGWALQDYLRKAGADQVLIEDLEVSWLNAEFWLHGLDVRQAGRSRLRVQDLRVVWDWGDLLADRRLRSLGLNGAYVELQGRDGVYQLAGLSFPMADGDSKPGDAWALPLSVDQTRIYDSRVSLDGFSAQQFAMDRLYMGPLLWSAPLEKTAIDLEVRHARGAAFGSRTGVLNLSGWWQPQLVLQGGQLGFDLQARLEAMDLAALAELAPKQDAQLRSGRLDAQGRLWRSGLRKSGPLRFKGQLKLDQLELALDDSQPAAGDVARMTLAVPRLDWQGSLAVDKASQQVAGRFAVAGVSLIRAATLNGGGQRIDLDGLEWEGSYQGLRAAAHGGQQLDGKLSLDSWSVTDGMSGQVRGFASEGQGLAWMGGASYRSDGDQGFMRVQGRLDVAANTVRLTQGQGTGRQLLAIDQHGLSWNGLGRLSEQALRLKGRLKMEGGGFSQTHASDDGSGGKPWRQALIRRWDWRGDLLWPDIQRPDRVEESSHVSIKSWRFEDVVARLSLRQQGLEWQGKFRSHALQGESSSWSLQGDLASASSTMDLPPGLVAPYRFSEPLSFKALAVDGLKAEASGAAGFERLMLDGARLVMRNQNAHLQQNAQLIWKRLTLDGLSWQPEAVVRAPELHVKTARLEAPSLEWKQDKQRGSAIKTAGPMATPQPANEAAAVEDRHLGPQKALPSGASVSGEDAAPSLLVSLERGELLDGHFLFADKTQTPEATIAIGDIRLVLEQLNNRDKVQPMPITLKARWADFGSIALDGHIQPWKERPDADLTAKLSGIGLSPIAAYLQEPLKRRVLAGQLDVKAKIKINGDELNVDNDLLVQKLKLAPLLSTQSSKGNDDSGASESEPGPPIELALLLLQDSHGDIRLSLPVSGKLSDPSFDLSDVVGQALTTAIPAAAALFIQPLGTVLIVGKLASGAASRVRFKPVEFEPMSSALDRVDEAYLDALAEKLKARPHLSITVCGIAASDDANKIRPPAPTEDEIKALKAEGKPIPERRVDVAQLRRLASKRASGVKRYLLSQHGVSVSQLVGCEPSLELGDELDQASAAAAAKGRVELGL